MWPLSCCVSLSELVGLSEPQSPSLESGAEHLQLRRVEVMSAGHVSRRNPAGGLGTRQTVLLVSQYFSCVDFRLGFHHRGFWLLATWGAWRCCSVHDTPPQGPPGMAPKTRVREPWVETAPGSLGHLRAVWTCTAHSPSLNFSLE